MRGFFILGPMKVTSLTDIYSIFKKHPKIVKDSRQIEEGCLYLALKGENFNGNQFANDAIQNGAAYAIVDDAKVANNDQILLVEDTLETLQKLANHHRHQLNIPILGITGSNGKTTTKELVHKVLQKKFNTYATKGNYNNHIGVPLSLLEIDESHEMAVIEMGANHQGEIKFLSEIAEPDFGLITNIGKAHLEGFGGIEGVKKGKSELYRFLETKGGKIFINQDDETLIELSKELEKIGYGQSESSYCFGQIESSHPYINGKWECNESNGIIEAKLYGDYNFYNLLAAVCIGNYFGVEAALIDDAINSYESDINRSQLLVFNDYRVILDAYNANPSSMELAINNFIMSGNEYKITILGDMFEVGKSAAYEHKKIIDSITSENKINLGVFVGENFYNQSIAHDKLEFFRTTDEAKIWFEMINKEGKSFLIKGSRGMKLESLID